MGEDKVVMIFLFSQQIQADVSRMAFGQDLAFRCPFCLGKAFQTVKEAIRHLE